MNIVSRKYREWNRPAAGGEPVAEKRMRALAMGLRVDSRARLYFPRREIRLLRALARRAQALCAWRVNGFAGFSRAAGMLTKTTPQGVRPSRATPMRRRNCGEMKRWVSGRARPKRSVSVYFLRIRPRPSTSFFDGSNPL